MGTLLLLFNNTEGEEDGDRATINGKVLLLMFLINSLLPILLVKKTFNACKTVLVFAKKMLKQS